MMENLLIVEIELNSLPKLKKKENQMKGRIFKGYFTKNTLKTCNGLLFIKKTKTQLVVC